MAVYRPHQLPKVSLLDIMDVNLNSLYPFRHSWATIKPQAEPIVPVTSPVDAQFTVNDWRLQVLRACCQIRRENEALEKARALVYARLDKRETTPAEPGPQDVTLTDEMLARAVAALKAPRNQVLSEMLRLEITRNDLETLTGLNWLNDNVINFYLTMVVERAKADPALPKVYAFNTFFVTTLEHKGYPGVRRWTKKIDLFSHDIVLVPVHLGMHWCMAVIDMRDSTIKYYDSMGMRNDRCLRDLLDYLTSEMKDKKKEVLDMNQWRLINVEGLPQQNNGSDCGMFACKYAEYAARDARLNFTQADMPYFRRRMIVELLDRRLMQAA
ncbi:sentrin-specific protease 1-like [Tropilaelaps mercedesae]|uniref:Sentrin-specific protease 1-like n=1 Tax=Tropilaelaps mercedesae TaxID=418985 RepID=A0A1V9XZN1_9ACAR|nr:sentrin-specific protease 1-like [Tropilaelaps mercedesae]